MKRPTVRQAIDGVDAVGRLGLPWIVARARIEIEHRAGLLRRSSPQSPWNVDVGTPLAGVDIVDAPRLADYLAREYSPTDVSSLRQRVADLRERKFNIFGETTLVDEWNRDPLVGQHYGELHWSDVAELPGADVKVMWEPARFTWAFDVARMHLLEPEVGHDEVFWELLEDFVAHNPPNTGVQWMCGQESSIRCLSVLLASQAMASSLTAERSALVAELVGKTGERVASHLSYAASQRNNHLTSEIMGLVLAAAFRPDHPSASSWMRMARKYLSSATSELVFADGGTSQYSMNYHRVFLDAFIIIDLVLHRGETPTSPHERRIFERAGRCLGLLVDDRAGSAPFFGHDDGARLLALSRDPHRALGDSVGVTSALWGGEQPRTGAWEEALAWLSLASSPTTTDRLAQEPSVTVLEDFGVSILRAGETTVWVRAGHQRYRPAHADQLNVDIWHRGAPVTVDRGTDAYSGSLDRVGAFASAFDHSTIIADRKDHMPRVSRFLWAHWVDGRVVAHDSDDSSATATFEIDLEGRRFQRTVTVSSDRVVVQDQALTGAGPWETVWQLHSDRSDRLVGDPADEHRTGLGRATSYREIVADVVEVRRAADRDRVTSVFDLAG